MDNNEDALLSSLVERGGIFYELSGNTVEALIAEFIRRLPGPEDGEGGFKTDLYRAVLEREALMATGIGHGIALPHPRNPLVREAGEQFVSIGFSAVPLDWGALDGKPVHTALLIVSASAKFHLHTFSKINFLCQDEAFLSLLRDRAPRDRIIGAIREAERRWN
jgi:PTS system nitrogen regulatory IIA component